LIYLLNITGTNWKHSC